MEPIANELNRRFKSHPEFRQRYQQLIDTTLKDEDVRRFLEAHRDELAPKTVDRGMSKLYEFVQTKKALAVGKPVALPGYLPRLVLSKHQIEVQYVPSDRLQAQRAERARRHRVMLYGMPKSIAAADLTTYVPDNREEALNAAIKFTVDYEAAPTQFHKGLYLAGSFGVGKTYLLGAIANELAKHGFKTTMVHVPTLATMMRAAIDKHKTNDLLATVKATPVLMLDDLGAMAMSSWFRDEIFGVILEYRMQQELPTFFSANITMDELEKNYLAVNTRDEVEPLKAKRLMERIRFLATEYDLVGKNWRNPS
ncbi:primosomal protein DnaI [Ligilactobacillus sp. LYQ139]|uniref:primosomal protein DnaI n=1 Tax=Ligilactobacillus sp. LYQ139 TaxID=3378800 RepID=UPI003852B24F